MRIRYFPAILLFALFFFPLSAQADAHALLIACSDFITQPDLGGATSGNLHMIGSALISSDMPLGNLSIEDGTIGTVEALQSAAADAFSECTEEDFSLLYLCTHGVVSSADDNQIYLLLGDGQTETPLSAHQLFDIVGAIPGEKLLILDACFSGAMIGRGMSDAIQLPGAREEKHIIHSPFLRDPSIHVLTSANGHESGWYYDSADLQTGAVSYFASALSSGLGLYGLPEADLNSDGIVTLSELHRYLSIAVPSSSSQLLSANADGLQLPVAADAALSRPLTGFSFDTSLLDTDDPTLYFSFTAAQDGIGVQYRLIDYSGGSWDWKNAQVLLDAGNTPDGKLTRGRKKRALSLDANAASEGGYLMLQVFSVTENDVILCSERLIAVQPADSRAEMSLSVPPLLSSPGQQELPIDILLDTPAELTVSIFNSEGALVRRLSSSMLTRPSAENVTHLYWDGRDAAGMPVPSGVYTIAAEAVVGRRRQKDAVNIAVGVQP